MNRMLLGAVALAASAGMVRFGGWAVVHVKDAPDYFVVNKPATFDFVVRQHGVTPMDDLRPTVNARNGIRSVTGTVTRRPERGVYRASLTIPSTGNWSVTIETGFGIAKGRMLSKPAIADGEKPPAIAANERGRQLFASAGCVTCHYHSAVDMKPLWDLNAPVLSEKRFAANYLAQFLANPSIKPQGRGMMQMPDPQLRQSDIVSLIAFINDERKLAAK